MSCSSTEEGVYTEGESAARGAIIFKHRCAECHTLDQVRRSLTSVGSSCVVRRKSSPVVDFYRGRQLWNSLWSCTGRKCIPYFRIASHSYVAVLPFTHQYIELQE